MVKGTFAKCQVIFNYSEFFYKPYSTIQHQFGIPGVLIDNVDVLPILSLRISKILDIQLISFLDSVKTSKKMCWIS